MILKSSHCAEIIIIFFPPYLKLSGKCPPCRRCARCGPDTAGTALAGLRAPSPSGCYPGGTRGIPSPSTVSTRPGPPATAGPPEPLPPPGTQGPPSSLTCWPNINLQLQAGSVHHVRGGRGCREAKGREGGGLGGAAARPPPWGRSRARLGAGTRLRDPPEGPRTP